MAKKFTAGMILGLIDQELKTSPPPKKKTN